jgi:hypothetical protein
VKENIDFKGSHPKLLSLISFGLPLLTGAIMGVYYD